MWEIIGYAVLIIFCLLVLWVIRLIRLFARLNRLAMEIEKLDQKIRRRKEGK